MTDTLRTATEQLLVSNAIDQAVSEMDFRALSGKTVFFDPQFLDGTVDRGYLVSSIRQQLLACGCLLQDDRTKADYVVEVRSGGVGTDRHALLVGVPQTTAELNMADMLINEKTYKGSIGGSCKPDRDFPMLLDWFKEGKLDLNALVTRRYRLDQINEATEALQGGQSAGRSILEL